MDSKVSIQIGFAFGLFVFGGIFFKMAGDGQVIMGLIGGAMIGIVASLMAIGLLSPLTRKDTIESTEESNSMPSGFNDPRLMDNNTLIGSIAGQADWLDKMIKSPYETQKTNSIVALAAQRKSYLSRLCLEVVSRGGMEASGEKYPGATQSINVFEEATEYFENLVADGVAENVAAVRAVKKILFVGNGVNYLAEWE